MASINPDLWILSRKTLNHRLILFFLLTSLIAPSKSPLLASPTGLLGPSLFLHPHLQLNVAFLDRISLPNQYSHIAYLSFFLPLLPYSQPYRTYHDTQSIEHMFPKSRPSSTLLTSVPPVSKSKYLLREWLMVRDVYCYVLQAGFS